MAITDSTIVQVVNLVDHPISYVLPELQVTRRFDPHEAKNLPISELRALNYKRGGRVLLHDYLSVKNNDFRKEIGITEDIIEYDYSVQDIDKLLLEGDIDVLKDALEFGPRGIVELIKSRAVKLKIPDLAKRQAIKDIAGTDVHKQIALIEEQEAALARDKQNADSAEDAPTEKKETAGTRKRRVATKKEATE